MKTDKTCICGSSCGIAGLILGILFGVAVALLYYYTFIPAIVTGVWIAFGIAALSLVFLLTLLPIACCQGCEKLTTCLQSKISCLIVGTIGTILAAIAALSIDLTITATVAQTVPTIIIAIGAFFFMFLIVAFVSFFKCLTKQSLK